MQDLRKQMATGVAWMVAFKLVDRGIGLISTLILARLLVPADFGIVAMATSVITFLELSTSFSFDVALIQNRDAGRDAYDTAWTCHVILGLLVGLLLVALSPAAAKYFRQPEIMPVMCALAVGAAAGGFENIGVVAFRKELRFDREFRFLFAKRVLTSLMTVVLALMTSSYWALVAGIVFGRLGGVTMSYALHPYRPAFSLKAFKELANFSAWMLVANFLHFLKERSADFIIGRVLGAKSVGLFSISYELSNLPATELVAPINRAVFPAYASIGNDQARLRVEYLTVMGMITLVAVPAVAGIAATAELIVPILLGKNWVEASPILALLAFFGVTQVMNSNAHAVYLAVGRPNIAAQIGVVHVVTLIVALLILTPSRGLRGAAFAYLLTAAVVVPISFAATMRLLRIRLPAIVEAMWRPLTAASIMFFVVEHGVVHNAALVSAIPVDIIRLLIAVTSGVIVYVGVVAILWHSVGRPEGPEAILSRRIVERIKSLAIGALMKKS